MHSEEVTFEKRPECSEGANHAKIWLRNILKEGLAKHLESGQAWCVQERSRQLV